MKRNSVIWVVVAVAVVVALGTFVFVRMRATREHLIAQESVQHLGEEREEAGEMTKADQIRLSSIPNSSAESGAISDQDLDWAINLLQKKPIKDTEANRNVKAGSVMLNLSNLKNLSAPQQQKLYQALYPYLTQPTTEESHSLKLMAIRIVGHVKIAAAKPVLLKLAEDKDGDVDSGAVKALTRINSARP